MASSVHRPVLLAKQDNVRIEELDSRVSGRIDALDVRVSRFETNVSVRFDALDRRIDTLETRLDAKIDGVDRSLRVLIEDLRDQIRFVAEVQSAHGAELDRVASDVAALNGMPVQVQDLSRFVRSMVADQERRAHRARRRRG